MTAEATATLAGEGDPAIADATRPLIEKHGIDLIGPAERHGTARQTGMMWSGLVLNVQVVVYGALLVIFGLNWWQCVLAILLGSGGREFERGYRKLAARYPAQCAVRLGFDQGLSHRIEAACDFYLMPSRFEPCGLNQMYSLRYGTIPIVRVTGGLDDSVTDISQSVERADGVKFLEYSPRALAKAIRKALVIYNDKRLLEHYRRNAMAKDFSWERTAREYEKIYHRVIPGQ